MKIYYNPKLKTLSGELRNNSTLSEVLLWNMLKSKKMKGYQFMRQKPTDNYIVDFYCSKLKLVIEIDGDTPGAVWPQPNDPPVSPLRKGGHRGVKNLIKKGVFTG